LSLVEGVRKLDFIWLAVLGVNDHGKWLADSEFGNLEVNLVFWVDLIIVGWVRKGQWKHALLLQVGFVDTGKRADDNGKASQVSWFQSSVFTRRTFTIIPVTDNNPWDTLGLVVTSSSWNSIIFASGKVLDLVGFTILGVDGTNQHVVGDVVQMSTVLEPRTGHGNVISSSFALALDENWNVVGILAVPGLEWLKDLETVRGWRNVNLNSGTVGGWCLISIFTRVKATSWKCLTSWCAEHKVIAILVLESIGQRVKVEGTSNGQGNN